MDLRPKQWGAVILPWSTPYNGLYREAQPEMGTFFRPSVYERVGILLVEAYEKVGKSDIVVTAVKKKNTLWFCDFIFKSQCFNSS